MRRPSSGDAGGGPTVQRGTARSRPAYNPVRAAGMAAFRRGGPPTGSGQVDVPERDDAHPQPPPPDRRRVGRHSPRRGPTREASPPHRGRGGKTAGGTPGVGACPEANAIATAQGNVGEPDGDPPRTHATG